MNLQAYIAFFVVALCACSPAYPPPEGFVDACYGGDWNEKMSGLSPSWSVDLYIGDEDLSTLRAVMANIASSYPVKHYDVGEKFREIRPIDIHICSEDGLFISATKLGVTSPTKAVMIDLFAYEPGYEWEPIAEALKSALFARWPENLDESPNRTTELRNSLF